MKSDHWRSGVIQSALNREPPLLPKASGLSWEALQFVLGTDRTYLLYRDLPRQDIYSATFIFLPPFFSVLILWEIIHSIHFRSSSFLRFPVIAPHKIRPPLRPVNHIPVELRLSFYLLIERLKAFAIDLLILPKHSRYTISSNCRLILLIPRDCILPLLRNFGLPLRQSEDLRKSIFETADRRISVKSS